MDGTPPKSKKPTDRASRAFESGPMPSESRLRAHRSILDALQEMRAAYQSLVLEPPSAADARQSIERAAELLAGVPRPYAAWTDPIAARALDIADGLPPPQLRWRILEVCTQLLGAARDLVRMGPTDGGSPGVQ